MVKVLGPSIYRIVDCANPRRRKVVHMNRLKLAPLDTTPEEADEYFIVHSLQAKPPLDHGHINLATILEEPIQNTVEQLQQLDHPVPEVEHLADPTRAPPPAAENYAPALRRSTKESRPPVRYGNPVVLPDTLDDVELFE